jgi:CheY-like chemotaxis protein
LLRALGPAPSEALPSSALTILVIEDDATIRVILRRHLEAGGYRVLEAVDGHSGLDLIETHQGPLDLVLTDIEMPRIDGITVAEVLMALRPLLGVVCMSGGMTASRFVERLALRPQPFLAKPFTPEALMGALGVELARSRDLTDRLHTGPADGPAKAPSGVEAPAATGGLVAAARRLQQGYTRKAPPPNAIQTPHASGWPLASEEKS